MTAEFYKSTTNEECGEVIDEICMYYDCQYISLYEACWHLFGFDIQFRTLAERLSFHLLNEKIIFLMIMIVLILL